MTIDARLDELAVLYLGLAHGIDGRMHFHEFTRLAQHLERWRHPGDRRSIPDLVEGYVQDFDPIRVIEAVENLGRMLSEREKRVVLDDLSEIALADQRFQAEEAEYIGRVAYEWETHPPEEDQSPFWTILSARDPYSARIAAIDLATLFLAAAHEPDGDISEEELVVVTTRMAQWLPDLTSPRAHDLVREAMTRYPSAFDKQALTELVGRICAVLPRHQRPALVLDLRAIARADGNWSVEARGWVDRVEKMLCAN